MTQYEVLEIGGLDSWRAHFGGFRPAGGDELPHLPDASERAVDRDMPWRGGTGSLGS